MNAIPNAALRPVAVKDLLVVDISPDLAPVLRTALAPGTWTIHHATSNLSALAMVKERAFDLILTSEKTSVREDVDLLRRIRRVRPHTRLIILAHETMPGDVLAAVREHAFSYFSVPFSPEELAGMIQAALAEPAWDDGIEVISATPEWVQIRVRCDLKTADRLLQFMSEVPDLPDLEKTQVAVAFREMLLNAMEHGAHMNPDEYVRIEYVRARRMITCRISDPGPGFTLDEIPHAAVANPGDDPIRHTAVREAQGMRPGGYGVLLAQQLVDQLIYNQDGNEVLLIKYLPPKPPESAG